MTHVLQQQNRVAMPAPHAEKMENSAEEVSAETPQIISSDSNETTDTSAVDELVITSKSSAPKFQPLDKTLITIGREDNNDISLGGTAVSRHHARIEKRNDEWHVIDLGSTNGTFLAKERLVANIDYTWQSGHPLQVGAYTLQWQSPRDLISGQTLVIMPGESPGKDDDVEKANDTSLNVVIDQPEVEIGIGESATIKLGVLSDGSLDKTLGVSVFGIPDHWVDVPQRNFNLKPKKHRSVPVKFNVPQSMLVEAGSYDYEVQLQDAHDASQMTRVIGKIIVPAVNDFSLRMVKGDGVNIAPLELTLKNLGNVPAIYTLDKESDAGLNISGRQWSAALTPGLKLVTDFQVLATERPLFGSNESRSFTISMQDGHGETRTATSSIEVTPRIPVWMMVIGITIFLIGLVLLFLFGG